jgi:predicted dithiol-disulfide oxidoreductase (DUF899 family)/predicted 3-demethylubiquinone-9 3-methyltransferase (glyoxalase superfamily)
MTEQKITPCLWFDFNAEQAVSHYLAIFKTSRVVSKTHYGEAGPGPAGAVMTILFEIDGQQFLALNGGPQFKFTPALSLIVSCDDQAEIDAMWDKLAEGGEHSQCGWLTDKFGVSWQIVPRGLPELLTGGDAQRTDRLMRAVLAMKKLDIALTSAYVRRELMEKTMADQRLASEPLVLPPVVSDAEWRQAHDALMAKEKAATRARDALAAERRRQPMVRIEKSYVFDSANGNVSLVDLFAGRRQLIVYHFMFGPGAHGWPDAGCPGCSMFVDQIGHLAHLNARDVSFALVSIAPLAKIEAYRKRMGWNIPWVSSALNDFNRDFGMTTDQGEKHGLSVFLRDGDRVYRTYFTTERGVEALGSAWSFLDLTPFGRQETWEDSPEGRPQTKPYGWWRRHDDYAPN